MSNYKVQQLFFRSFAQPHQSAFPFQIIRFLLQEIWFHELVVVVPH